MTEGDDAPAGTDPLGPDALDFWLGRWSCRGPAAAAERTPSGESSRTGSSRSPSKGATRRAFSSVGACPFAMGPTVGGVRPGSIRRATYLDFVGVDVDGRIAFERKTMVGGVRVKQRMVWLDVGPDSLRWQWQRSDGRRRDVGGRVGDRLPPRLTTAVPETPVLRFRVSVSCGDDRGDGTTRGVSRAAPFWLLRDPESVGRRECPVPRLPRVQGARDDEFRVCLEPRPHGQQRGARGGSRAHGRDRRCSRCAGQHGLRRRVRG